MHPTLRQPISPRSPPAHPVHPVLPHPSHLIVSQASPSHPHHAMIPTAVTGMSSVILAKLKPYREHPEVTSPRTPTSTHKVPSPPHSSWEKMLVTVHAATASKPVGASFFFPLCPDFAIGRFWDPLCSLGMVYPHTLSWWLEPALSHPSGQTHTCYDGYGTHTVTCPGPLYCICPSDAWEGFTWA